MNFFPAWLYPQIDPEVLNGAPRAPHTLYDEPDEYEQEQRQRKKEQRKAKHAKLKSPSE